MKIYKYFEGGFNFDGDSNTTFKILPLQSYGRNVTIQHKNFHEYYVGDNGKVERIKFNVNRLQTPEKFIVGSIKKEVIEHYGSVKEFADFFRIFNI